MDEAVITGLFNTIGIGGVFLYAAYYLMKRLEAAAAEAQAQALKREERLVLALGAAEAYTRTTMTSVIERNTEALHAHASALEGLACRELRTEDLKPVIENVRRRAGEG